MATLDYYKVLGVAKTADHIAIKAAYRSLAFVYHPDHSGGDKAKEERFKEISEAYTILCDPDKRTKYDKFGHTKQIVIPSKKGEYLVEEHLCSGDLSEIYLAKRRGDDVLVILKVAKHPSVNDLLTQEANRLKKLWPADADPKKYGYYYLSRLIDQFKIEEKGVRRQVNVLEHIKDYANMKKVRDMFPRGVQLEHTVWMFNRLLEGLAFIHKKNQIHGALVPTNVLVWLDPKGHLVKFLDWGYAGESGESIKAIAPEWRDFYPKEVFDKKPATCATDIFMAARLMSYMLSGGDIEPPVTAPNYLISFLRHCTQEDQTKRPQNAWTLHEDFKELMARNYGPKKFVPFNNPAWDNK